MRAASSAASSAIRPVGVRVSWRRFLRSEMGDVEAKLGGEGYILSRGHINIR
jgi:hypothetical protein